MEDVSFANGIALSQNEDFLLINECGASKIWKYWLKGEKRGQKGRFTQVQLSPE